MAPPDPVLPVSVLRAAVADAVKRTSSHAVARGVGMSAPSLRDFINGSEPRQSTLRKLTAWYIRTAWERGEVLSDETARAALALLVEHLPEEKREEAVRGMLADLWERTEAAKVRRPGWLR
jgi:hypothetical protein